MGAKSPRPPAAPSTAQTNFTTHRRKHSQSKQSSNPSSCEKKKVDDLTDRSRSRSGNRYPRVNSGRTGNHDGGQSPDGTIRVIRKPSTQIHHQQHSSRGNQENAEFTRRRYSKQDQKPTSPCSEENASFAMANEQDSPNVAADTVVEVVVSDPLPHLDEETNSLIRASEQIKQNKRNRVNSARQEAIEQAEILRLANQERMLRENQKSLELRLAGCLRTIKQLQKEN